MMILRNTLKLNTFSYHYIEHLPLLFKMVHTGTPTWYASGLNEKVYFIR